MQIFFKNTAIALVIVSLTACLEVEDNNNNDNLVAALQQQNEILAAQNQAQQTEASVTLTGKVTNISTDTSAQNASVKIKIGNDWSEPMNLATDGSFELNALPFNSDYTLVVQSADNSFLNRTFYGTTRSGSTGINYQDIGSLQISEGELKSVAFLDSETNKSILGLEIYAFSHLIQPGREGVVSDSEEFYHTASYNEATSQYEIMLPKDIDLPLLGSLDLNGDGDDDYRLETLNYSRYLIEASALNDTSTLYLMDITPVDQYIEFRVSVLSEEGNVLEGLSLIVEDAINGKLLSAFDSTTNQYVINANFQSSMKILLPAFNIDDKSFDSSTVSITTERDELLRITVPNYSFSGYHTSTTYNVPANSELLNIVLQPKHIVTGNSPVELISKTINLGTNNTTYKAFYSQAIDLNESSVELMQKNVFSIIRGNDDQNDLVLPGSTVITKKDIVVDTTNELSLGNTLLTVMPKSELQAGFSYQYIINEIIDSNTGDLVDISSDYSLEFTIKKESDINFDINTLSLDNNNYYNNGELIKIENTAGEASNPYYQNKNVYIIIPSSAINTLKNLTLQKMIVTKNNVTSNGISSYEIIKNGRIYGSAAYAVSASENEDITYNDNYSSYIIRGLASSDGEIYRTNTYEYLYDNTEISENSITFEYAFETIDGEVSTGTITLDVQ